MLIILLQNCNNIMIIEIFYTLLTVGFENLAWFRSEPNEWPAWVSSATTNKITIDFYV